VEDSIEDDGRMTPQDIHEAKKAVGRKTNNLLSTTSLGDNEPQMHRRTWIALSNQAVNPSRQ